MIEFEKAMEWLSFSQEKKKKLLDLYGRKAAFFQAQAEIAYDGSLPEFAICKRSPIDRLVIWCRLVPDVAAQYRSAGVSESIIRDTMQEIVRLCDSYRKKTGKDGLSKENVVWLRHIRNAQLFWIGSLQYQLFHMVYLDKEGCGEAYIRFAEEQKERLPQGTPVINVHIPSGADLSEEAVTASLASAKRFFAADYPDFGAKAFICYSWLLYPGMLEILPKNSNIAMFASNFRIIGQVSDPYGSDAVKRIYGRRFPRRSEYPQDTQLQRNAVGNFSKLGMGCGVIEFT